MKTTRIILMLLFSVAFTDVSTARSSSLGTYVDTVNISSISTVFYEGPFRESAFSSSSDVGPFIVSDGGETGSNSGGNGGGNSSPPVRSPASPTGSNEPKGGGTNK